MVKREPWEIKVMRTDNGGRGVPTVGSPGYTTYILVVLGKYTL